MRKLRKIASGVRLIRYIAYVLMHEALNKFAVYFTPPPLTNTPPSYLPHIKPANPWRSQIQQILMSVRISGDRGFGGDIQKIFTL